jgi:DNA-binding XRE family transcriptional regulator
LDEPPLPDLDQRWIKALSHPVRVGILQHFLERGGDASPKDLAGVFRQPIPRISYHMRRLHDAGQLTLTRRMARGSTVGHFYRLANPPATADALRRLGIARTGPIASTRFLAREWVVLRRVIAELRTQREAQGISRETLARRVGIKPSYLGAIERCEADPRYTVLADLTRELGTTISEVFGRAEAVQGP